MIQPEDPPSFIVRTELQKAASNNGFRLEREVVRGWMHFGSTTAQLGIWIAGASKLGPWLLSVDRLEVAAESHLPASTTSSGPGVVTFEFDSLDALYSALETLYRLGVSLPDSPLREFRDVTSHLPRETETQRLVIQRVGQEVFRKALIAYWGGRCPLTGIKDVQLLRASHIVPWAECDTDQQRLDVHNGLLLSALWDAAFDAGLVAFDDDGSVLYSRSLGEAAVTSLSLGNVGKLPALTAAHRTNLAWHRAYHAFQGGVK